MSNRYLTKMALAVAQEHQQRVLDKLSGGTGMIAAHSMGSGKTLTALLAIQKALEDKSGKDILVIVPAPLVSNMQEESVKHGIPITDKRVQVMSYEAAVNKIADLSGRTYSLVVMDEAHRLRNKETKRASELDKIFERADKSLLLTGTPSYNKPQDIAVLVNKVAGKKVLPDDQKAFEQRYIGNHKVEPGFFAKTVLGVTAGNRPYLKNTNELKSILKQYVDVYDAKVENPADFPSTHEKTIKVEMDDKQQRIYHYLEGNLPAPIRWKIRMGLPLDKKESANLNAFSTGVRQASNDISPFDKSTPEGYLTPKIHKMADSIEDHLKSTPNFRAYAYSNYLDAGLRPLKAALDNRGIRSEIFDGSLSKKQKDQLKLDYNEGRLPVLLLSSSGAEGLNLKGTKLIQVMEPHFNRSKIDQVVARGVRYKSHEHLPEDERNVIVEKYHSTLKPSITDKMLGNKGKSIDEYLDGMSDEKQVIQKGIMDLIKSAEAVSMNRYLMKIAEDKDMSWLLPAVGVAIPTAAGGLSHYAAIRTREPFENHDPEKAKVNKALKRTALKSALGLSIVGGIATAGSELARRKYLESEKDKQSSQITKDVTKSIKKEILGG